MVKLPLSRPEDALDPYARHLARFRQTQPAPVPARQRRVRVRAEGGGVRQAAPAEALPTA